jgi:hypothetical protein
MTNGQNKADETGLICAYELDGQGGGRSMAWQDIGTSSSLISARRTLANG